MYRMRSHNKRSKKKVSSAKVEKMTWAHLTASVRLGTPPQHTYTHAHTHIHRGSISVTVVVQDPGGGWESMHPQASIS